MANAKGIDFQLYVNTGTYALPVYTVVGGQRGATLNQTKDTIESTNKTTGGYKTFEAIFKEWSIDADSMLIFEDAGFLALQAAYQDDTLLKVQIKDDAGNIFEGDVFITEMPLEFAYDDFATLTVTLQGTGALVFTPAV